MKTLIKFYFTVMTVVFLFTAEASFAVNVDQNAWYRIVSKAGAKSIHNQGYDTVGAKVHLWDNIQNKYAQWKFIKVSGSYYKIVNRYGKKVMTPQDFSKNPETPMLLSNFKGNRQHFQQWSVEDAGGGYVKIINRGSGLCLDIKYGSLQNGTPIIQWKFKGSNNQLWKLDSSILPASSSPSGSSGGSSGGSAPSQPSSSNPHAGHNNSSGSTNVTLTPMGGDLPLLTPGASSHQDHSNGFVPNSTALNGIAATVGAPDIGAFVRATDALGAYNAGQPEDKKIAGAYLTMITYIKMKLMSPFTLGNEGNASRVYGALKRAGMDRNAASIRTTLAQNGGNTGNLSDEQLVRLWGTNEHWNLHAVLNPGGPVGNAVHMTSINDRDMHVHDGMGFPQGGYNDRGEYPQWGWYETAKNLMNNIRF